MKTHFTQLNQFCEALNRRHLLLGAGLYLIDWACAWGLLAVYDRWVSPFQEQTAAIVLFILCLLYIGSLYPVFRWHRRSYRITQSRLAQRMESTFPELNDLLVTATHLEEKDLANPNPLEVHVMDSAEKRLGELGWKPAVTRSFERISFVFGMLAIGIILLFASFQSVVLEKALHHIRDDFGRSPSGLVISSIPDEVAAPNNLDVQFKIHRWQKQASIEWIDSAGENREPVVVDESGVGLFTFYNMTESLQFRIITPSLRSTWHDLEVYAPARIEKLQITVSPPAYTRLEEQVLEGLSDIEALERSEISIQVLSPASEKIELLMQDRVQEFDDNAEGAFTTVFHPTYSTPYSLSLLDERGRKNMTASKQLTILTDNPPTVEILTPERDSVLAPGDIFPLEIFAADDFGLSKGRVHLAISGTDLPALELPLDEVIQQDATGNPLPLKETNLLSHIDLGSLQASDGDLLAIYIVMEDNREPEPNQTRTDLLFVEIREPIEPVEMDGMPMEQKAIDFRELIEEQKRLLRETHRVDSATSTTAEKMRQEIPAALGALAVEIQRIYNEVEQALVSSNRMDLAGLFMQALAENAQAVDSFENGQADKSVTPQSSSLSALLKLENAFRQNTKSKQPAKGSSGEGESGEQSEEMEKEPPKGKSVTEALKEAKEQLDELLRKQNALVSEFDRAARSGWSGEQANASSANQEKLGEDTRSLRNKLNSLEGSENAGQALAEARQHMKDAAGDAAQADAEGALRSGFRAREALRIAAGELAGMIAEAATRELDSAAQAAAELAEQQAAEAGASESAAKGNPSESEMTSMESSQRDLQARFEQLLESMEQRAQEAAGSSPQLSQALREAARSAGQRGTADGMERAANALLYGQPGMAAPMQATAAGQISQLAGDLQAAREQMASDPTRRAQALNRELQTTLEELQSLARKSDSAPQERLSEIQNEWSTRFMELQQLSGLPQFGSLSGQIAGSAEGSWDGQLSSTRNTLQEGARLLRSFLFDEASQSDLQMNRESAPPPDQYRKMVEEYFRRLAREPEN
ncbi:hypothetical protein G0Q06_12210 [Puniceicoccales bacterium CK1056]|uniref:DUF4175 family protein n=1 Tax=Oceanipulchritudo coccoides TaxID=2706888 RepID=A0A6B2M6C8_9BACT|nr:DUF4175 family protein [Oceanipulchritudo coccoides]NDV63220.1 hypothetical protein [Oceanipulchritudo coccoides]